MIVHDQWRQGPGCYFVQPGGESSKFVDGFSFSAELNQINAAFDHLLRDASDIGYFNVAQINDSVETAFTDRPHELRVTNDVL
jgi:hypothetical protein